MLDPTICDSYRKQIRLDDGKNVLLDILDTAGQEEFRSMRDEWIREGDGFLLVYSITDAVSFSEIDNVREEIMRAKEDKMKYVPLVLVGTLLDEWCCVSGRGVLILCPSSGCHMLREQM